MRIYILAWRNLWRNPKRTLITVSAVFMAVFLSSLMTSMQEGTYVKMIDNVVKFYSGYIQVYKPGYRESGSIDDVFKPQSNLLRELGKNPDIEHYAPRLESFALLSTGSNTRGASVIGIDPSRENSITNLSRWITNGNYLKENDDGILMAVNLAKSLRVKIGDTLTLMSQGYHGETAAGLFPVRGILTFPSPQLNNFGTYISLNKAREFFSAPGMVSSLVIIVKDYKHVKAVDKALIRAFPGNQFLTWDEIQPELIQMIEGDRAGGIVMKGVLYLIIGFGILGTIIMMMSERGKEMGITIAVGMQKTKLMAMMFFETLYMGLVGVASGFLFSIPVIAFMQQNPVPLTGKIAAAYEQFGIEPVLYFSMVPKIFFGQAVIVLLITLAISLYQVNRIYRLNAIHAIRS